MGDSGYQNVVDEWLKKNPNAMDNYAQSHDLNAANSQSFYNQLTQAGGNMNPNTWLQGAQNTMNPWNNAFTNQLTGLQNSLNRDPADIYRQFQGVNPLIGQQAAAMADMAVSPFGQSMDALAAQQSTANRRALEQRMAASGLFGADSGAARRAIGEGVSSPYAEAAANVANTRAGIFNSMYNPQANMVLGQYFAEPEKRLAAMQGINQGYGSMFNAQAGLGSNLMQYLGDQSQQQILAPQVQYQQGMGDQLLQMAMGGLVGGLTGGIGGGLGSMAGDWLGNMLGLGQKDLSSGQINNLIGNSYNSMFDNKSAPGSYLNSQNLVGNNNASQMQNAWSNRLQDNWTNNNPYAQTAGSPDQLKIGQFLQAGNTPAAIQMMMGMGYDQATINQMITDYYTYGGK